MGDRLTVLDVVRKSADFLDRKSVESPRLNAEWLAAHALNIGRMELYMQFDRPLQPAELDLMRDLVSRLGKARTTTVCSGRNSISRPAYQVRPAGSHS